MSRIDEPGATGEIFLGGGGLALGYIGQPGQTAQRFVADPYGPAGSYLYRTGDRGRWNRHGDLEFLDRIDNQVQIRGHRIEPGEVETALRRSPYVRDAVVVAHESIRRQKTFLVAFLAVGPAFSGSRSEIVAAARRTVASLLPVYMTPARYEIMEYFPSNGSAKTDRGALARSFRDRRPSTSVNETRTERVPAIRELTAEVLCEVELDESLSFFELGGDSMDAIELVASARRAGLDLRLPDVITGAPLGDVLRLVDGRRTPTADDPGAGTTAVAGRQSAAAALLETGESERIAAYYATRVTAPHGAVEDIWPLAPLQEGLIAQSLYDDTMPDIYTVQVRVDIDAAVDPARLCAAVSRVVSAHPALRSAFVLDRSDEPVQVVLSEVATEVAIVDLPGDADRSGAVDDWLLEDRRRRFDLTVPPLHRFTILRLGEDKTYLVFTHHHTLLDGWSVNIVLSDVLRLCRDGGAATGSIDPGSPRAFALWAREQLGPEARDARHGALRDVDGLVLAPPGPSAPSSEAWSEEHYLHLSAGETGQVTASAAIMGVTPATVVAGAWAVALGRAMGRDTATHGFVVSGRECPVPGTDRTVGLLMNTIPVAASWSPGESWAVFLTRLQKERARLAPYWSQPLREIRRAAGAHAAFDTCLVFGTYPTIQQIAPEVAEMVVATSVAETAEFSLTLHVQMEPHITLRFTYWPHAVDRQRCEQIAGDVRSMLLNIAEKHQDSGPHGDIGGTVDSSTELVSKVFREVLRREIPGPDADFFELGGDSIMASRVTNRIKALTGTRVPTRVVFDLATPRGLAEYLDRQ